MSEYLILDDQRSIVIDKVKTISVGDGYINFKFSHDWLVSVKLNFDFNLKDVLCFMKKAKDSPDDCFSIQNLMDD